MPEDRLRLMRIDFTDISTIGDIQIDGKFECYSLEDTCRKVKIKGKTAIPPGRYEVLVTYSTRFKRDLPILLVVPNFEGIRIHPGNTGLDTDGCILPGRIKALNWIGESQLAFSFLFIKIKNMLKDGKLFINIIGGERN